MQAARFREVSATPPQSVSLNHCLSSAANSMQSLPARPDGSEPRNRVGGIGSGSISTAGVPHSHEVVVGCGIVNYRSPAHGIRGGDGSVGLDHNTAILHDVDSGDLVFRVGCIRIVNQDVEL